MKAVDYTHKKGIAHLDIKLQNILLTDKGVLKLCDFGHGTNLAGKKGDYKLTQ